MKSSRRLRSLLSLTLCCALLAVSLIPASALRASATRVQGSRQSKRGRKVKAEPPQPGAPSAAVPDLDDVRQRPPAPPHTPLSIPSTLRSRHKPLVSRRGRRVGDPLPLPTPSPAVPTPTPFTQGVSSTGASPSGSISPNFFDATGLYAFYTPRFLVSPSDDQLQPFPDAFSSFDASFDFFALSMLQAGGGKVVFSSNRDGHTQIYLMNADGSGQARLTSDGGNDDSPRWSPNGNKIIFQSDRDNPSTGYNDIYVMNSDGTGQTRLTTDPNDDSSASWSSDGSRIVFQSIRNGQYYQVYSMNADGTNQVNLSNSSGSDGQPSWSPDGTRIAFASERDHEGFASIYVMNANGTGQTRLTFSADDVTDEQPVWSRDGSKIAFVSTRDGNKEIYVMNADGSNQTRLTNDLGNDDSPYWSPDGTKIIFRSDRQRDCCDPTSQVWVMNSDGTNLADLSGNGFGDYSSSWASGTGNQPPVAKAGGPYNGVPGQNTVFNGAGSFDSDGSVASYSWNFGDGGTAMGVSPTHAYTASGTYTVTLTVIDNLGAQGSATTTTTVSSSSSDGFVTNFLQWGLGRQPTGQEGGYWDDILRSAYPQGQTSMLLSMREFGMTVFESSEYAGRNRSDHWYVYDLYKTYLMRDPDSSGWAFWEAQVPSMGREQVRHAFDQSTEFGQIIATLTASGQPSSAVSSLATARVDPFNQTGDQIRARDCEWGLNLLSLPGRAGLDLGLGLSYSSLVWTRSGPYAYFDEDRGALGPGFRLGFATVQGPYFDAQVARNVYVVVTSSGDKVELRQVGATSTYEAGDSSHLQLMAGSGGLLLRTTDGTQITYSPSVDSEWRATAIEDRNGNYLSVSYMWWGDVLSVSDTLGRTVTFNYDANENLQTITQNWTVNGQTQSHTWATFGWGTRALQPGFSSVAAVGTYAGETIPVMTQVGLDDGSRYNFEYTAAGQVNIIHRYSSDNVERSRTTYDYATLPDDCPRLIDTQVSADSWTGVNGVPAAVVTQFTDLGNGSHEMTAPDGTTTDREIYGTGWQKGLVIEEDVSSGGALQRQALTTWDQDNTSVNYQTNPRVKETNIYDFPPDAPSNRRRTTIDYGPYVQYGLPNVVTGYDKDGVTPLRQTYTDYNLAQGYLNQRIIGLVSSVQVYDNTAGKYLSKTTYGYDEPNSVQQQAVTATAHDQSYDSTFMTRGNVTSVSRWDAGDINNTNKLLTSHVTYDAAGSVLTTTDPASHQTSVSYADSFSDGNNTRNTFAYPTTLTDADGFSSTVQYNFDFAAKTRVQGPPPANQMNGVIQVFAYDSAARIQQVTTQNTGAYVRYIYGPNYTVSLSTVNNVADEAYTNTVFDGMGRAVGVASNHPGSTGGYKAQLTQYDLMGRAMKQSNPAEIDGSWNPAGDDAAGWLYTQQTYDWKGRPLVTTNTDGTQKSASYDGCGCAGGEVATLTDEAGREQKVYSDPLGRQWRTEVYNWDGTVYSTTESILNALDQPAFVRRFQGSDQSGVYQETAVGYDGYARLQSRHAPDQDAGHSTTYSYNPDDTLNTVTDARGATATYSYNDSRRLVTGISYSAPSGVTAPPSVTFGYDAAGNRTSMTTANNAGGSITYGYDSLSRLKSEARQFPGLSGTYTLSYQYNLANALTQVSDVTGGTSFTYTIDTAGRVTQVDSAGMGASASLASNAQYRAWGALKHADYGNGTGVTFGYDGKLMATSYSISGVKDAAGQPRPEGGSFQYYPDARIKFASDYQSDSQTNGIQDRAYSYDHEGRLLNALTGTDARNFVNNISSNVSDGPYMQTYSYDAWDNQTSRVGSYWGEDDSDTETFAPQTNRNPQWGYDTDGRLLSRNEASPNGLTYVPARFAYDAAGRQAQTTQTTSRPSPNPHSNSVITTALTQADTYDGDGLGVERAVTKQVGSGTPATTVTYYLRSSVLGGRVVTEYNSSGARKASYAWSGRDVLAQQTGVDTSFPALRWEHLNPVTGDGRETDPSGVVVNATHLDPGGADAGESNPFAGAAGDPSGGGSDSAIEGRVAALMSGYFDMKCSIDGILSSCALAGSLLESGAADLCKDNDCGPRAVTVNAIGKDGKIIGSTTVIRLPGQSGWDGSLDGTYNVLNSPNNPVRFNGSPDAINAFLNAAAGAGTGIGEFTTSYGGVAFQRIQNNSTGPWVDPSTVGEAPPVPPSWLGKVQLTGAAYEKYLLSRGHAVYQLGHSAECRQFLIDHGIDPDAVIEALNKQNAYDGTLSTITRGNAGVVDHSNPTDVSYANFSISSDFPKNGTTNAETGVWPGLSLGTTLDSRSDVYWRPNPKVITGATIVHEALHSLLHLKDEDLQLKLNLSTKEVSENITLALRQHGCE
jgi:YD repeat-containing protein